MINDLCRENYSPTTKTLNLICKKITDKNIPEICSFIKVNQVENLSLSNNSVTDKGVEQLAKMNLVSLNLNCNHIGLEGIKTLANHPTLENLELAYLNEGNLENTGVFALANNPKLKDLDLTSNVISLEGIQALASNQTLISLSLNHIAIPFDGLQALASNKTLKKLSLFRVPGLDVRAVEALSNNQTLIDLNLGANYLQDTGITLLTNNISLRKLHLPWNNIGDEGAKTLATSKNLMVLNLSNNKITDIGANLLANNNTLKTLFLNNNLNISQNGFLEFLQNETLTKLDSNGFTEVTRSLIDERLTKNREIERRYNLKNFATPIRMAAQLGRVKQIPLDIAKEIAQWTTIGTPFYKTKACDSMFQKFFNRPITKSTIISTDQEEAASLSSQNNFNK